MLRKKILTLMVITIKNYMRKALWIFPSTELLKIDNVTKNLLF